MFSAFVIFHAFAILKFGAVIYCNSFDYAMRNSREKPIKRRYHRSGGFVSHTDNVFKACHSFSQYKQGLSLALTQTNNTIHFPMPES